MKGSTAIGWVVVVISVALVAWVNVREPKSPLKPAFDRAAAPTRPTKFTPLYSPPLPPNYHLTVESFRCERRGDDSRAEIVVANDGADPIELPKVYFKFGPGLIEDALFDPVVILPGSLATAFARVPGRHNCSVLSIQDGKGHPVRIDVKPPS